MAVMQFLVGMITRTTWGVHALICFIAVLLLTAIGLGFTVWTQSARLETAKTKIEALDNLLAIQNRAVETWKAEAEQQAQRVREASVQAEQVRTVTVERVRTIPVAPIPSACPEAVKWGAQQALEINRQWERKL